jgi:hypothetical protein
MHIEIYETVAGIFNNTGDAILLPMNFTLQGHTGYNNDLLCKLPSSSNQHMTAHTKLSMIGRLAKHVSGYLSSHRQSVPSLACRRVVSR